MPGVWLTETDNEVLVLELEPNLIQNGTRMTAKGLAVRDWFNQPDPDCVGC